MDRPISPMETTRTYVASATLVVSWYFECQPGDEEEAAREGANALKVSGVEGAEIDSWTVETEEE